MNEAVITIVFAKVTAAYERRRDVAELPSILVELLDGVNAVLRRRADEHVEVAEREELLAVFADVVRNDCGLEVLKRLRGIAVFRERAPYRLLGVWGITRGVLLLLLRAADACLLETVFEVVEKAEDGSRVGSGVEGWRTGAAARGHNEGSGVGHVELDASVLRLADAKTSAAGDSESGDN